MTSNLTNIRARRTAEILCAFSGVTGPDREVLLQALLAVGDCPAHWAPDDDGTPHLTALYDVVTYSDSDDLGLANDLRTFWSFVAAVISNDTCPCRRMLDAARDAGAAAAA